MKTIDDAVDKPWNLELIENFFLTAATVNYFVELIRFHLFVINVHARMVSKDGAYEIWLAADSTYR